MTNTMALEALSRSNLYGLLAAVTRAEIDGEMLVEFRKPEVLEALREAGADLTAALEGASGGVLIEEMAQAYTYLFLLTLSPHESVQRGEGQLWGDHTVAANKFMMEIGLAMPAEQSLLPDHIAIELEVMQHLASEEAAALESGANDRVEVVQALQKRFLKEHLGVWGVEFFGTAERLANHDFYRQMARLGRQFLYSETESLGV